MGKANMLNGPDFIAKELVGYLLPVLPYLFKWGKLASVESTKKIGNEIGQKIPEVVREIWGKLWEKFEHDPVGQVVIENASQKTDSGIAKDALEVQFAKLLRDEAFRSEMMELLKTAKLEAPKLNIDIVVDKVEGSVIGLNALDQGTSFAETTIINEKVNTVSKGGSLIGVQLGNRKRNKDGR